jgi:hypothetical protein
LLLLLLLLLLLRPLYIYITVARRALLTRPPFARGRGRARAGMAGVIFHDTFEVKNKVGGRALRRGAGAS